MVFAENGVRKWVQKPSRTPAVRADVRTASLRVMEGERSGENDGSRGRISTHHTAPPATAPTTASVPNAVVHPAPCSTTANGTAVASWPD